MTTNFTPNEQTFLQDLCKLFCADYRYEPQFFSVHEFYRITENYVSQLEIAESRMPAMSWQFALNLVGHLNRHQFLSIDKSTRVPSIAGIDRAMENDLAIFPPNIGWRTPYVGMSDVGIQFLERCHPQRFVRGSQMNHEDYLAAFYPIFIAQFPAIMGFSNLHQWLKSGKVMVNTPLLAYQRDSRHCDAWKRAKGLALTETVDQAQLPFMSLADVIPFLEMCRQEGFVLDDIWGYAENGADMDGRLSRVEILTNDEKSAYRQLLRGDNIAVESCNYLIACFTQNPERFMQDGDHYFERFGCSAIAKN